MSETVLTVRLRGPSHINLAALAAAIEGAGCVVEAVPSIGSRERHGNQCWLKTPRHKRQWKLATTRMEVI